MERTVVVTGGTDGIGRAVAEAFADAGARVVVGGRDADAVAETVESLGDRVTGVRTDVRDQFDVERLVETASKFGERGVDYLCPCAFVTHGAIGEMPMNGESYSAFDDHLRTNARGVFTAILEALPHLTDDARVVVPTPAGARADPSGYGTYGVSTAAAAAVVRGFAADLDLSMGLVAVDPAAFSGERPADDAAAAVLSAATEADPADLDGSVVPADVASATNR